MNLFSGFRVFRNRGIKNRPMTDEDVLQNAKPLTSAILSRSAYRRDNAESVAASKTKSTITRGDSNR